MPQAGKSYAPVFGCKLIGEIFETLPDEFEIEKVVAALAVTAPQISRGLIHTTFANKVKEGVVVRLEGDGVRFRKVPHTTFVKNISNGVIAEALWGVLLEGRQRAAKKEDLIAETERRVAKSEGRKWVDLATQVSGLLKIWSDGGYLRNYGGWERGDNSYQILPGVTVRPAVSARK